MVQTGGITSKSTRTGSAQQCVILDEATRNRRQRKALEALEKDNYQEDLPALSTYVSDYRIQLNKRFQQKFSINEETAASTNTTVTSSSELKESASTSSFNEDQASSKKKRMKTAESKLRFKKNLATLLEEEREMAANRPVNYFSIQVPESKRPQRKFCSVCGFQSNYTCIQCGAKYCTTRCLQAHRETRCLKWTV